MWKIYGVYIFYIWVIIFIEKTFQICKRRRKVYFYFMTFKNKYFFIIVDFYIMISINYKIYIISKCIFFTIIIISKAIFILDIFSIMNNYIIHFLYCSTCKVKISTFYFFIIQYIMIISLTYF